MQTVNIILCGLGGQGILFMTRILAEAALGKGFPVLGAETHGMAQRGGSVVSHLRLGPAKGSLVRSGSARFVLALDENEAYRNLPFLAPGASLYSNSESGSLREEVDAFLSRKGVVFHSIPAGRIALEMGSPMAANLALLGYFSAFETEPLDYPELRNTIENISPERFREINLKVFDAGHQKGLAPGAG